ncbi:MAG: protease inhibitor Inh [Proteobacteria bacterium]|nr:protease inhibitor Inh [Pseudomonadota bacterium]
MRIIATASVVSVLALAACSSYAPPPPRIVPLAPQPVNPVMSQALPAPVAPTMSQPTTDMAMAQPTGPAVAPGVAADVRKADLIGGWTLASAGETCQLSMNLTTWSGGFRASTRGCVSDELKSIGAWDVAGKEILLKDASGSVVARLYAAAPNRYSGQTDVSKRGVQFFRG